MLLVTAHIKQNGVFFPETKDVRIEYILFEIKMWYQSSDCILQTCFSLNTYTHKFAALHIHFHIIVIFMINNRI